MSKTYNMAIVGATGLVGGTMLSVLEEDRELPIGQLRLMATANSAGKRLPFRDQEIAVEDVAQASFKGVDIALFAGGETASADYVRRAVAEGAVAIDNSSLFRMDPQVPLVVPEVNGQALERHRGIIANPNCSTIQLMPVLAALHREWGVESVSIASYQSVSGAGKEAVQELRQSTADFLAGQPRRQSKVFPHSIAFNLFPQIGSFDSEGHSTEEWKMVCEARKIMDLPQLPVLATCVRVPVFFAHSEAVQMSFSKACDPQRAREILAQTPCVKVLDDTAKGLYPTPIDGEGQDLVLVGRIRRDMTAKHGLAMWIVADNLRKGAATNAVNIARALIARQG